MLVRKMADDRNGLSVPGRNGFCQVKQEAAFSLKERICLLIMALGFLAPVSLPVVKYILPEVAMLLFIFASGKLRQVLLKVCLFLAALYFPLLIELIAPASYFPLKRNLLICSKLTIFVFFMVIFVNRCRNPENAVWVCKKVIMPLAIIMTVAFMIDQVTSNTFFAMWHQLLSTKSEQFFESFTDLLAMDSYVANGFLTRVSDVPPWCFMGIASVLWLYGVNLVKKPHIVLLMVFFILTLFIVPKRSSLIVLVATSLIFIFFGGWRLKKHILLLLVAGLVVSFIGAQYLVDELLQAGVIKNISVAGGYNRLMASGLGQAGNEYDDRIVMGLAQIEYLLDNPRHLLVGAGWDFASAVWIKPHSTVLGILAGGGIFGMLTFIVGFIKLFKYFRNLRQPRNENRIYLFSLIALLLYNVLDSAFFYAIEYPGSLFVLWMTWTVILYGVPMPFRPRKLV